MTELQIPFGSEPARDEARPVDIIIGWTTAIASRLAPTGDMGVSRICGTTRKNCGSVPARDEARPVDIIIGWRTAIASRLAPTGDMGVSRICGTTRKNCGSVPARDEARPVDIIIGWRTAIASRLAPIRVLGQGSAKCKALWPLFMQPARCQKWRSFQLLVLKGLYKASWLARPMQLSVNTTSALEAGS
ncbi:hypothetical protein N005_08030 [Pseudomonas mediterranea CFBP 5447]|nr:hypothetical protein N005_08030 [Pseudomonas mediterranea CFBP 5447]